MLHWAKSWKGTPSWLAPGFLLVAALFPAASLLVFRLARDTDIIPRDPLLRALMVVAPLSTFLLAVFLCQTRQQLHVLRVHASRAETARAQNAGKGDARSADAPGLDAVSRLPNRLFLDALLQNALGRGTRATPIALFRIDIDGFARLEALHGRPMGEALIVGVAERFRRIARGRDCLARVEGEAFALMLADASTLDHCVAMADRVHDAMLAPFEIDGVSLGITLSTGIALAPHDGATAVALVASADRALARAKAEGGDRFTFFDRAMEQKRRLGATIESELRAAIKSDSLTILYQPLMNAHGTRMRAVEALVRWRHPEFGLISPEDFIPIAEHRGLIVPLGEWVLRKACADAQRWPGLGVAVNVSPIQFRSDGFVGMVGAVVAETGIDANRLELELTEGVLIEDAEQAETIIIDLRAQGIRMGLDDFGSGYSSMIYLRRFAFDKIKIDKALLDSMETSGESAIILRSIVSLGHALGLTVTAEGIETREQADFLAEIGCDELQGFYFSEPVPAEAIDAMVARDFKVRSAA
jgi:diguanylate cyclase (GGDEF)-like protein